jgi:hypothetical protein
VGFVDVWVAGQIDHRVQASLGIITQSLFLFLIIVTAVSGGAVAAISQSLGAGKRLRADRYTGLCLAIAAVSGLALVGLGLPLRPLLVRALQVPQDIARLTDHILEVFLFALPPYSMMRMLNAVFRARRLVMTPLYTMVLVTLVNTLGDLGLGLGLCGLPRLGVTGVIWSTFFSVTAGALFGLAVLRRGGILRREIFAPWRWARRALPYLLKVALPAGLLQVVWHFGYLVLFASPQACRKTASSPWPAWPLERGWSPCSFSLRSPSTLPQASLWATCSARASRKRPGAWVCTSLASDLWASDCSPSPSGRFSATSPPSSPPTPLCAQKPKTISCTMCWPSPSPSPRLSWRARWRVLGRRCTTSWAWAWVPGWCAAPAYWLGHVVLGTATGCGYPCLPLRRPRRPFFYTFTSTRTGKRFAMSKTRNGARP